MSIRLGFAPECDLHFVNSVDGFVLFLLTFAPVHAEFGGLKRIFIKFGRAMNIPLPGDVVGRPGRCQSKEQVWKSAIRSRLYVIFHIMS